VIHFLTITVIVLAVVLLLVVGTSHMLANASEEGCGSFETAAAQYPTGFSAQIEAINATISDPLAISRALCGAIDRIEERGADRLCFALEIAVTAADRLLSLWPLEMSLLNGHGPQLGAACAKFSSSVDFAKTAICEPLFDGNETLINGYLDSVGSTLTTAQYSNAVVDATLPGGSSESDRLSAQTITLKLALLRYNDLIVAVISVALVSCLAASDLREPVILCIVGVVLLFAASFLVRSVFVCYHRFVSFWQQRGVGAIPVDAAGLCLYSWGAAPRASLP
jgi:hypothetical protein